MCHALRCTIACLLSVISLTVASGDAAEISIVVVGDITVGSGLTPTIDTSGIDVLFAGTAAVTQSADIAVTTLNTSISDRGEPQYGVEYPFRAVPALARGIANAGFDLVSLATPHVMDFGVEALEDTIRLLNWYQVKTAGAALTSEAASEPVWLNVKTAKVAFLAYYHGNPFGSAHDDIIARAVYSEMISSVKKVSQRADVLVVSVHWGKPRAIQTEQGDIPPGGAVSKRERFFAHGIIDAGAALVLSQRLHTLQGLEVYKRKPILYSLADFVYETYDKQHAKVVIPKVTFADAALKSIELTPIGVDQPDAKYQPHVLSGADAREALIRYQRLCAGLNTQVTITDERGWIQPGPEEEAEGSIAPDELF